MHPLAAQTRTQFNKALTSSGIQLDTGQRAAVAALAEPSPHGYYLWGNVGRGKSLIADQYFMSIPTPHKRRFHFHDFFHDLHAEIRRERAPFRTSVDRLLGSTRAVLFDEFHVHDVADGVFLASTLHALVERNILLLTTSNYAPEGLMPNPYFHDTFAPTIELIKATLRVINVADGQDYRNHHAASGVVQGFASGTWNITAPDMPSHEEAVGPTVVAAGHPIRTQSLNEDQAEFAFGELCERPLGVEQYIWIGGHFTTVTITGVPDPVTITREPLLRFGNLVDVLYDRDIQLNVIAGGPISHILAAKHPPTDALRTVSRLTVLKQVSP